MLAMALAVAIGLFGKRPPQPETLTAETFAQAAYLKDDQLATAALISMETVVRAPDMYGGSPFLRAVIDKKTGAATFQVYERVIYDASAWRNFTLANFEAPAGPGTTALTEISHDVLSCSGYVAGKCTLAEDVAFPVTRAQLEWIARKYPYGSGYAPWTFVLRAQAGPDQRGEIPPAEAAGLLKAVTTYTARFGDHD